MSFKDNMPIKIDTAMKQKADADEEYKTANKNFIISECPVSQEGERVTFNKYFSDVNIYAGSIGN